MSHVLQLSQLLPVVFVQPPTQTWIKEADERKNAKMQDICSKETKTTVASLYTAMRSIIIDKDKDATRGPLIVCRKSMEGSVISDRNVICVF